MLAMLVKDRSQAVATSYSSFSAPSVPQSDQILLRTRLLRPLTPDAVVQGHFGLPVSPIPGCMASSHVVMSVSDVWLTLGHSFE